MHPASQFVYERHFSACWLAGIRLSELPGNMTDQERFVANTTYIRLNLELLDNMTERTRGETSKGGER